MLNEERAESLAAESPDAGASEPQGETPEQPEGTESATVEASESTDKADESVSAPEAAKRSDRSNAETRIKQLTARNRDLERKLAASGQRPPTEIAPAAEPTKPKLDEFDSIEKYEVAQDEYVTKLTEYREKKAVEKHEAGRKATAAREAWDKRAGETARRHPEFDTNSALAGVNPTPAMDGYIVRSPVGPDILHYLHENPDEADRIRGMDDPFDAVHELVVIGMNLSDQIKGIKAKTAPPKPPKLVDGAGTSPAKAKSLEEVFYG